MEVKEQEETPVVFKIKFFGESIQQNPISISKSIISGDLSIVPIIALDCSLGNLTFGRSSNLHETDLKKRNDYLSIMKMI